MTLDDVLSALCERGAVLAAREGDLRYVGPVPLEPDAPLRAGIAEHRAALIDLFTYAPGSRCVFAECFRLVAAGDRIACREHRAELDAVPWLIVRAGAR